MLLLQKVHVAFRGLRVIPLHCVICKTFPFVSTLLNENSPKQRGTRMSKKDIGICILTGADGFQVDSGAIPGVQKRERIGCNERLGTVWKSHVIQMEELADGFLGPGFGPEQHGAADELPLQRTLLQALLPSVDLKFLRWREI